MKQYENLKMYTFLEPFSFRAGCTWMTAFILPQVVTESATVTESTTQGENSE